MATTKAVPKEASAPAEAPPVYTTGAVKQDPVTLAVAVRTNIPHPDGSYDWGVMSVDKGGWYVTEDQVAGWTDMERVS
jgi:hypothetical protein